MIIITDYYQEEFICLYTDFFVKNAEKKKVYY